MEIGKDVLWGFCKPIKDVLFLYLPSIPLTWWLPTLSSYFNIWIFMWAFSFMSISDDIVSQYLDDKKYVRCGYYYKFDAIARICGMIVGVIFVWVFLTGILGINLIDGILSVIMPIMFLLLGIWFRTIMSVGRKHRAIY